MMHLPTLSFSPPISKSKVVDLSADYRFSGDWTYGLPERSPPPTPWVLLSRVPRVSGLVPRTAGMFTCVYA